MCYVIDKTPIHHRRVGQKLSVVLPISDFEHLLEELEELEDIRLYDEAKASDEPSLSIDEAFKIIEESRKTNF